MRRSIALIALLAATPAMAQKPDPLVVEARAAITAGLKDPASAQFQNVRAKNVVNLKNEPMQVVCGDVNAKNGFGGFTGFAPWIYLPKTKSAHLLGPDRDISTISMIKNFCS